MKFPEIDYQFWLLNWKESVGQLEVYTNKNMKEFITFEGELNACTEEIKKIVYSNTIEKSKVLRVVDLIYSWGGKSGRMFYVPMKGESSAREKLEDEVIFSKYLEGVKLAKEGNAASINKFSSINGIGSSYGSKHAYFWSLNSENPLVIIDSKIVGTLGYRNISDFESDFKYDTAVQLFVAKASKEYGDKDPSKVEKALFAFHKYYFLNDNSGWSKNLSEYKNFDEATRLSEILFGDSSSMT